MQAVGQSAISSGDITLSVMPSGERLKITVGRLLVRDLTAETLRYGMCCCRFFKVLPTHPRIYPQIERTFPTEAGPHLPTLGGWKVELA